MQICDNEAAHNRAGPERVINHTVRWRADRKSSQTNACRNHAAPNLSANYTSHRALIDAAQSATAPGGYLYAPYRTNPEISIRSHDEPLRAHLRGPVRPFCA